MKPLITLTESALKQCQRIIKNTDTKALKLSLNGGGCNGFEYKFETVNLILPSDELYKHKGTTIAICNKSLLYLLGTEIDWKTDIMGKSFHFNNPNAGSVCGCGTSFNPKE